MSDQPAPPDSSAVDAALKELREALEQERRENDTEMTAATEAFAKLKALYDDQTRKYSWAENQRQEFWRLYNFERDRVGLPKQPTSRPYTLEEWQAELAKLPPVPDVKGLTQERDAALARAERAEAELATLKEQQGQAVGLQVKLKKAMTDKGIKLP